MRGGDGRWHGSTSAAHRPNPHAFSAQPGDDPRLRLRLTGGRTSTGDDWSATTQVGNFSPFVPASNDSESRHADPPGTSLALSDRLARDQPDRALHAGRGALRALPATAWSPRRATRRRRRLVGYGDRSLVRRSRAAAPPATGLRAVRAHSDHAQAGLSRDRPPQPRPDLQRATLAQSCRALPALPHDPRRSRASPSSLVERVPPASAGRPLFGSLQLVAASAEDETNEAFRNEFVLSSLNSRTRLHLLWRTGSSIELDRRGASNLARDDRARFPAVPERGGGCLVSCRCPGGQRDRTLPLPQDDRDGATAAGR